jgi:integrase
MMNIAKKDGLVQSAPYFPMLTEDNVREGFVETLRFIEILKHLPDHLRPLIVFLFTTGCRVGAALRITWDMVSADCTKMTLPGTIVKNKKPIVLALSAELTAVLKKQFRKVGEPIFDGTNLRREWAKATAAAGCPDLIVHDLRRSGARNLREAGVDETVIMKIGGWKTRSVFIRYGIVATKDIENAMDLLQKNNGTLMEPDAKLAQR